MKMGSVLATVHHKLSTLQTVVFKRQMKTNMEVGTHVFPAPGRLRQRTRIHGQPGLNKTL